MFKKQFLGLITVCIIMLSSCLPALAAQDNNILTNKIQVNGQYLQTKTIYLNKTNMVPVVGVSQKLGYDVKYYPNLKKATIVKDGKNYTIQAEKPYIDKGEKLAKTPFTKNRELYVSAHYFAEVLGDQVGWDNQQSTVIINDYSSILNVVKENAPNFWKMLNTDYKLPKKADFNASYKISLWIKDQKEYNIDSNLDLEGVSQGMNTRFKMTLTTKGINELISNLGSNDMKQKQDLSNITAEFISIDGDVYVKTNLLKLLGVDTFDLENKWGKIPANSAQLASIYKMENGKLIDLFNVLVEEMMRNASVDVSVDTYNNMKLIANTLVSLVDNDKFKMQKVNNTIKEYTWNITEQDIEKMVVNLINSTNNKNQKEDINSFKQIMQNIKMSLKIVMSQKEQYFTDDQLDFNFNMNIPSLPQIRMTTQGGSHLTNVSEEEKSAIQAPGEEEVITLPLN
ncbi:copper amine oxidase N-terminal domain-containing protein [Bacillota bacterium LX-D]|nr:copper amine oxidase N-terminal domain-containing protein [Bacillota bacterium LX-D]